MNGVFEVSPAALKAVTLAVSIQQRGWSAPVGILDDWNGATVSKLLMGAFVGFVNEPETGIMGRG